MMAACRELVGSDCSSATAAMAASSGVGGRPRAVEKSRGPLWHNPGRPCGAPTHPARRPDLFASPRRVRPRRTRPAPRASAPGRKGRRASRREPAACGDGRHGRGASLRAPMRSPLGRQFVDRPHRIGARSARTRKAGFCIDAFLPRGGKLGSPKCPRIIGGRSSRDACEAAPGFGGAPT
jgi:hypothetical protein